MHIPLPCVQLLWEHHTVALPCSRPNTRPQLQILLLLFIHLYIYIDR